jgi:hypothetical protein
MPQTVFILGAGASAEVNLPTGDALARNIAPMCNLRLKQGIPDGGDRQIMEVLRLSPQLGDLNPYMHAGRRIYEGMPIAASIDNFLDAHRGDERIKLVGKLAIVRAILDAERSSRFFRDPMKPHVPLYMEQIGPSWFKWFWRLLCDECTADSLSQRCRSVTFIAFNYDRCIEQFLYYATLAYYGKDESTTAQIVRHIRIFHPYGSIASLPWQDNARGIEYGADELGPTRLFELATHIKTFTESVQPGDEIDEIRAAVNKADRIVFLGFAFHRQNMRLLWPESWKGSRSRSIREVFGTAKGFSESDQKLITSDIDKLSGIDESQVILRGLSCSDLFHEYSRSLSLL